MPKALPVTRGRKFLQVLEGARTIFLRDGFEGAAVDDIARDAGTIAYELISNLGKNPRFVKNYIR